MRCFFFIMGVVPDPSEREWKADGWVRMPQDGRKENDKDRIRGVNIKHEGEGAMCGGGQWACAKP